MDVWTTDEDGRSEMYVPSITDEWLCRALAELVARLEGVEARLERLEEGRRRLVRATGASVDGLDRMVSRGVLLRMVVPLAEP